MGEVYRAKDTRLDRVVAIKVLPTHLTNNPEMQQRFEREARAVSSLSHSNICTLYDVGRQDGIDYLVMEYIEGESLADRLTKGSLPLDQVLRYSIQMADALDKAHRQGIVHRDLKPGNIMLTKSGAKLLDFGLAKLQDTGPGSVFSGSMVQTERVSLTGEGTILGTFQYMSPEQLEGQETDSRTDIFAFGAVVYEMATGKKAFTGKSQASLIGSILREDPPTISASQSMTPPALDRVVKICLAKDPDDRWQSARDLAQELRWIADGGSQSGMPVSASTKSKSRERLAWILAALFLAAAVLLTLSQLFRRAPAEPRTVAFNVAAAEKNTLGNSSAISPDGRLLAFTATEADGQERLWIRPMDSLEQRVLTGTEGAQFPFWSPDSRFVGFFADQKLKKIEVTGARPQALCEVSQNPRGAAWNRDGTIIFTPDFTSPLYKVSAAGGQPSPITELDTARKETSHRWPSFLSDGRRFIYYARTSGVDEKAIFLGSLESNEKRLLFAGESRAVIDPSDSPVAGLRYLLTVRNKTLTAQLFDERKLELSGDAHPLADDMEVWGDSGPTGYSDFSVSAVGDLAYRAVSLQGVQFTWLDRTGKNAATIGDPAAYTEPCLSPDEKRVVFGRTDLQAKASDIWLLDLSRGSPMRFTFAPSEEVCPVWSPDGKAIVFSSDRSGRASLYQKSATGTGSEELLLESGRELYADSWSSDGRQIIYELNDPKTKFDLWVLPMVGERKPYPFIQTEFNETHSQFSPDGRWVAYVSDESGRAEVYVQGFGGAGGKWQISTGGGDQPQWRGDGKELFYVSPDKQIMTVSIKGGTALEAGIPVRLFEVFIPTSNLSGNRNYYVVADNGKKFLVCSYVSKEKARPITVVSNWTTAVKNK
jgi:eukaryotic-like serine/threonine-protein kinase